MAATKKPASSPKSTRKTTVTTTKSAKSKAAPKAKRVVKQAVPKKTPAKKPEVTSQRAAMLRQPRGAVVGFTDFLREQSVVGLAVGLVIGSQVKALADQLITSFLNPLIGLVLPGRGSLDQKTFTLHLGYKSGVFAWGAFTATLISFIITAAVVYFVFKSLKLDKFTKKKDDKK